VECKHSLVGIYLYGITVSAYPAALKHPSQKTSDSAATLIQIYECFCDETRLRIVNLLAQGPLCVCHLQNLLDSTQVRISKHLGYLKAKGVLNAERHQNWMIYSLPNHPSAELEANLKCLQDCIQTNGVFRKDLRRLAAMKPKVAWLAERSSFAGSKDCCGFPENARENIPRTQHGKSKRSAGA
jgi:ArsR family transcriptional regulator